MVELLSGVVLARVFSAANRHAGDTVTARQALECMREWPGGRVEERFTADGEWRGYRYTCHGGLWFEW